MLHLWQEGRFVIDIVVAQCLSLNRLGGVVACSLRLPQTRGKMEVGAMSRICRQEGTSMSSFPLPLPSTVSLSMSPSQVLLKLFLDELEVPLDLETFEKRLLIQRKTYLAQLTGFDLGYRFAWNHHGPYSRHLTYDLFGLKERIDDGYRDYEGQMLSPLARHLMATARAFWSDCPEEISEDDWLELLASLHFVRFIVYSRQNSPRDFTEAFSVFLECKPQFKDREQDAGRAWEHLRRVGLIDHKSLPIPEMAQ